MQKAVKKYEEFVFPLTLSTLFWFAGVITDMKHY